MKISGAQVLAARDLLRITQVELAEASGVGERTLGKFESDDAVPKDSTIDKIRAELERRGIEFTNGDGAGVRINFAKAAEFSRLSAQPRSESDR